MLCSNDGKNRIEMSIERCHLCVWNEFCGTDFSIFRKVPSIIQMAKLLPTSINVYDSK